jgi:hypothetical protein
LLLEPSIVGLDRDPIEADARLIEEYR